MGLSERTDAGELAAIVAELATMRRRVDELSERVVALQGGKVGAGGQTTLAEVEEAPGSEGLRDWLSWGGVLRKIAALCFILVIALLLRTVTDYGYVNLGIGTVLGLCYVAILLGVGFLFYQQQRLLAPVFAGCGFVLLFAIVVEGLNRFATLTATSAFIILLLALVTGAYLGMRFAAPRVLAVSIIGVAVSGLAGNFPKVAFPAAGGLLLAANLVALVADRRGVSRSLKWWVVLLTMAFWALWAFKIFMTWRHEQSLAPLYDGWYLPLLGLFGGLYLVAYSERFFRDAAPSAYDMVLPPLNMVLLFLAGRVLVVNVWGAGHLWGGVAVGLAIAHLLVGWRLSARIAGGCGASGGCMVAGALMLALGLPELLGSVAWALSGWALVAYGLARLSGRCDSGGIRVISYLYQLFALWIGLLSGVLLAPQESLWSGSMAAALALAVFGLAQYRWCRHHPPPVASLLSRVDARDYSAVILLLIGLSGLFFLGAMLLDAIAAASLADPANATRCGRSVLLNFGVLVLLVIGSRRRLPELLWVAVALAVVGCTKVFFVDLFKCTGLPLVLSVLSFGVVAAVGSVLMGRSQKQNQVLTQVSDIERYP